MKAYETLSQAITGLKEAGYVNDFNLHPEYIECPPLKLKFTPVQFHVDQVYRFEGMSSTDDNSVLYAISSSDGVKGLLMDAYGVYADSVNEAMIAKLRIDKDTIG
jgi:hypothetical protein